jgi:hypothetical protein
MSQTSTLPGTSERLLSLILLNEKIKDGYLVTKKLEDGKTIIQIKYKVEGKRSEEYVSNILH